MLPALVVPVGLPVNRAEPEVGKLLCEWRLEWSDGGAEGDRTPDLRIANATLSQLSYGPVI